MIILAIDTSGSVASCAIARGGEIIAYAERDAMLDHSSTLLSLCGQMLAESGIDIGEVDIFAAAAGPGSFTGIRIGVAAVKGFGWTGNKPCAGVSTLMAMACGSELEGRIYCRVGARPGERYYAFFERCAGRVLRLSEDAVGSEDEIAARAGEYMAEHIIDDAQNARGVALAAMQMVAEGGLESCHEIAPSYLRKPQAERVLEERGIPKEDRNNV